MSGEYALSSEYVMLLFVRSNKYFQYQMSQTFEVKRLRNVIGSFCISRSELASALHKNAVIWCHCKLGHSL